MQIRPISIHPLYTVNLWWTSCFEPNQQVTAVVFSYSKWSFVLGGALPVWAPDWISLHVSALLIWQLRQGNNKQHQNKSLTTASRTLTDRDSSDRDATGIGPERHFAFFISWIHSESKSIKSALQTFSQICWCSKTLKACVRPCSSRAFLFWQSHQ